ncbi:TRAP transporter small permease subunit [bacterium]|nr:TRAP transporter small permease subunit [bacterium]
MPASALKALVRICTALGALSIAVMMLATCWDILARKLAGAPLHGVVELVEIMVLACTMLGLPESFLRDEQIRVDILDSVLPKRVLAGVKIVTLLLTMVFLSILTVNVYSPMMDAMRFGDLKPDLGVPLYPLYGLIIFSFAASMLSCAASIVSQVRASEI